MDAVQPEGEYLKAIQKSLNVNRRVEGRIRKLQEEQQYKSSQWDLFENHMREMFVKEKKKFQKDMEQVSKELGELEAQKNQALQALLLTIESRSVSAVPSAMEVSVERADKAAWDAFVQGAQSSAEAVNKEADQDLANALLAAQNPAKFAELVRSTARGSMSLAPPAPATPHTRTGAPRRTRLQGLLQRMCQLLCHPCAGIRSSRMRQPTCLHQCLRMQLPILISPRLQQVSSCDKGMLPP